MISLLFVHLYNIFYWSFCAQCDMCLSTNNTGCRPIWRKLRGIPPNTKEFQQNATGACYIDPGNGFFFFFFFKAIVRGKLLIFIE